MASPGFPLRAAADGPRRIGMPRALLHYRYGTLWTKNPKITDFMIRT